MVPLAHFPWIVGSFSMLPTVFSAPPDRLILLILSLMGSLSDMLAGICQRAETITGRRTTDRPQRPCSPVFCPVIFHACFFPFSNQPSLFSIAHFSMDDLHAFVSHVSAFLSLFIRGPCMENADVSPELSVDFPRLNCENSPTHSLMNNSNSLFRQ